MWLWLINGMPNNRHSMAIFPIFNGVAKHPMIDGIGDDKFDHFPILTDYVHSNIVGISNGRLSIINGGDKILKGTILMVCNPILVDFSVNYHDINGKRSLTEQIQYVHDNPSKYGKMQEFINIVRSRQNIGTQHNVKYLFDRYRAVRGDDQNSYPYLGWYGWHSLIGHSTHGNVDILPFIPYNSYNNIRSNKFYIQPLIVVATKDIDTNTELTYNWILSPMLFPAKGTLFGRDEFSRSMGSLYGTNNLWSQIEKLNSLRALYHDTYFKEHQTDTIKLHTIHMYNRFSNECQGSELFFNAFCMLWFGHNNPSQCRQQMDFINEFIRIIHQYHAPLFNFGSPLSQGLPTINSIKNTNYGPPNNAYFESMSSVYSNIMLEYGKSFSNKKNVYYALTDYMISLDYNEYNVMSWHNIFKKDIYYYFVAFKESFEWNFDAILNRIRANLKNRQYHDQRASLYQTFHAIKSDLNEHTFDDVLPPLSKSLGVHKFNDIIDDSSNSSNEDVLYTIRDYFSELCDRIHKLIELDSTYVIELFDEFYKKIINDIGLEKLHLINDESSEQRSIFMNILAHFWLHFCQNPSANQQRIHQFHQLFEHFFDISDLQFFQETFVC